MKKNKALFIIIASVLAVQGCTVNVNPAAGVPSVHTHAPVVPLEGIKGTGDSEGNDQGSEGEDGIPAPQPQAGIEKSQPVQLMRRNVQVAPPEADSALPHLHAEEKGTKSDSAFGSKFWAKVVSDIAPVVAPAIAGALLR